MEHCPAGGGGIVSVVLVLAFPPGYPIACVTYTTSTSDGAHNEARDDLLSPKKHLSRFHSV